MTGEAVALELRTAALPSRTVAALIDAVLQVVLLVGLFYAATFAGGGSDAADAAIAVLVLVIGLIGYPVAFETALRGRTPGKLALGLRTVRDDGGPIGFRQALVRGLAGAFLERPGITLFFGAFATSLLNRDSKRLGDLLAGTVVLQERVPSKGSPLPQTPPELVPWARSLELTGLPDDLALQARALLTRSAQLTPEAREDLGGRLVTAVLARTSPPPPPGTPGWAVLAAVLAERTRRAQERLQGPPTAPPAAAPAAAPSAAAPSTPPPSSSSSGFTLPG